MQRECLAHSYIVINTGTYFFCLFVCSFIPTKPMRSVLFCIGSWIPGLTFTWRKLAQNTSNLYQEKKSGILSSWWILKRRKAKFSSRLPYRRSMTLKTVSGSAKQWIRSQRSRIARWGLFFRKMDECWKICGENSQPFIRIHLMPVTSSTSEMKFVTILILSLFWSL